MKTRTTILILFTLSVCILIGCSDPLAGPQLDTEVLPGQEHVAAKTGASRLADLSVRLLVEDVPPLFGDSLLVSVQLHNDGPDVATGVQVAFRSGPGCAADTTSSGGSSGGDNNGIDIILWDVVGVQPGEQLTLDLACLLDGLDPMVVTTEVMKSDARDPDSVPGDGDPDQDDYHSVTIYPEPPCSFCQR